MSEILDLFDGLTVAEVKEFRKRLLDQAGDLRAEIVKPKTARETANDNIRNSAAASRGRLDEVMSMIVERKK